MPNSRLDQLKIIYFASHYPHYSETFVTEEIDQLKKEGHEVVVCNFTLANSGQKDRSETIVNNTKKIHLLVGSVLKNVFKGGSLFFNFDFWRSILLSSIKRPEFTLKYIYLICSADYLLSKVAAQKVDLAVSHFLFKATLGASFMTSKLAVPLHIRLHTKRNLYTKKSLFKVLNTASYVTAIGHNVKEYYEPYLDDSKQIKVIRQSVNLTGLTANSKSKITKEGIKLIAIGRLVKKKGFDILIDALSLLDKEVQEVVSLDIFGDGELLESLYNSIEKKSLSDSITLQGKMEHSVLMDLLVDYDLLIVPSIELKEDIDGMPTVIAEAMSVGTPVLAFNTASIPELIIDKETGFLETVQTAEALAKRITLLVTDENERKSVIPTARKKVMQEYEHTLAKELRNESGK